MIGEIGFFRRIQVRIGTVSISLPFYFHEDTGMLEFLSTGYPCGIVCGFTTPCRLLVPVCESSFGAGFLFV